jgi:hypothetical protein
METAIPSVVQQIEIPRLRHREQIEQPDDSCTAAWRLLSLPVAIRRILRVSIRLDLSHPRFTVHPPGPRPRHHRGDDHSLHPAAAREGSGPGDRQERDRSARAGGLRSPTGQDSFRSGRPCPGWEAAIAWPHAPRRLLRGPSVSNRSGSLPACIRAGLSTNPALAVSKPWSGLAPSSRRLRPRGAST